MNPDNLFEFYRDVFLPAYSDFVGFTAKKPMQVLNELENTLAHLAQYYNPALNDIEKKENVRKSCDHLTRVTLDLYKLLWVEMHRELELFYLDEKKRTFALNMSEEDFIQGFNDFRNKAQEARSEEVNSVGVEPLSALELYKESIILGKTLIKSIDHNKLKKLNRFSSVILIRKNIIGLIIGFIAGLFANAFWNYIKIFF